MSFIVCRLEKARWGGQPSKSGLTAIGVLVIIDSHPVIRQAGRDNRTIIRKELDYEKK